MDGSPDDPEGDALRRRLIWELELVRAMYDLGADDWRHAGLRVWREYLRARGIERRLIDPIERMLLDAYEATQRRHGKGGRPEAPLTRTMVLAFASAAVTVQHERGASVPDAELEVAALTGLDAGAIRRFRRRLNSGDAPKRAREEYPQIVRIIGEWADLEPLRGLADFR